MRLLVALASICTVMSAVEGLRCYTCWGENPGSCNQVWDCASHYDRCSTTIAAENLVTKQCMRSDVCDRVSSVGTRCCTEDLCNAARRAAAAAPLLLAALPIAALFA